MSYPKFIWLYWENRYSDNLPDYLTLCLETVRHHAGIGVVNLVTNDSLPGFVSQASLPKNFDNLLPAHKADYLRVRLLHDFGGMWIDIDTVVFASLESNVLQRLSENELVSIGSNFSQQLFGSTPNGKFVASCLEAITERLEEATHLGWSDIGAKILYPAAEQFSFHRVPMKAWHFGWRDWNKYLEPGTIDYDNRLCCMLYNKMMFPVLRDRSRQELLGDDNLLASMFEHALGVPMANSRASVNSQT